MTEPELKIPPRMNAALALADGGVFFGKGIGKPTANADDAAIGEICFNTSMTGYQEILTDPSYTGQIITFTFPHIGNTGVNEEDVESGSAGACGLILRAPITQPSNFRSTQHFNDWLIARNVTGISGVDTRSLTRHIRMNGAQNAGIIFSDTLTVADIRALQEKVAAYPSLKGMELAKTVSCTKSYEWKQRRWAIHQGYTDQSSGGQYHVVALDFGVKYNILRCLADLGCRVTVVPGTSTADEVLAHKPDGIFLSNGPGDPAATGEYAVPVIQRLVKSGLPVFGICLGHQLLAQALGCTTEKMAQGHRGANHPVQQNSNGVVEITSQNHGFVVRADALPDNVKISHTSLFDKTIEGIALEGKPVFSVQHHPEASPGPHDSMYLFEQFVSLMNANSQPQKKAV